MPYPNLTKLGFVDSICVVALEFDIKDPIPEQKTDQQIAKIVRIFPNATAEMQLEATEILIEKLPFEPVNYRGVLHRPLDRTPRLINSFGSLSWIGFEIKLKL
jgi:hypothetical protein